MPASDHQVTVLLERMREGNPEASAQLIPLVYQELRRMAAGYMQRERPNHTLQATALVNEAYLRLVGGERPTPQNRAHFLAIAAHTMRQVLMDYGRQHRAGKRGGGAQPVDFDAELLVASDSLEDVLAVNEALERLEKFDPRQSQLIELRFFAGLTVEEAAEVMGISAITVKREWRSAKAWLHREMAQAQSG
jgi:RNA polymerase sigma factor (TIGR02999 family)